MRRHELLTKNPQLGRKQATDYMFEIVSEHEKSLEQYRISTEKIEKMLNRLMDNSDQVSFF